ncbi:glutamine amidotransferase [Candidatus Tenderia electrophaga]|jgi:putative intracellular protease/amidase|uniref:Glutamine amidotransferase n=1 Tax=Candidatus Tenderia electrophaga TaxID=1748243 RepID=A0A0S2TH74_9GAMM|nr:glutamine amidotransferase [Candidatus Tenderia electrophaga]
MAKSILIIVTSHGRIDAQHRTGLWFEEFAAPYTLFKQAGYQVTVASPAGGDTPIDPRSLEGYEATPENEAAQSALQQRPHLDEGFTADDYDAVFFPGGHGTMFDLPDSPQVQRLVKEFFVRNKVIAAVCHGPACLVNVVRKDGEPLVRGKRIAAFTDSEERAVELDQAMPFLLESKLREQGAHVVAAEDWQDNVVVDGNLVTGQNPQSSASAARAVIELLS